MKIFNIIVPVYNEEKTLEKTIEKILALEKEEYIIQNNIIIKITIVDDFSEDSSVKIAKKLCSKNNNIKLFCHNKNKGKGAALKTGFKNAKGDFIAIQDADEEYNPLDYIKLLKLMLENNLDVCYGSRYLNLKSSYKFQQFHTFINKFLTFLTNIFTNLNLTDMETCYKLFKAEVINKIAPYLKENRFGFEPEITIYIAKENFKIQECPIEYNPRGYKEGKKIKPKDGLRAIFCIFYYGIMSKIKKTSK